MKKQSQKKRNKLIIIIIIILIILIIGFILLDHNTDQCLNENISLERDCFVTLAYEYNDPAICEMMPTETNLQQRNKAFCFGILALRLESGAYCFPDLVKKGYNIAQIDEAINSDYNLTYYNTFCVNMVKKYRLTEEGDAFLNKYDYLAGFSDQPRYLDFLNESPRHSVLWE